MNKPQNGYEVTLYTVTLKNEPGALQTLLNTLKFTNITGLKLINSGVIGTFQFVVPSANTKTVSSILSNDGFFYTTSTVYGVYLGNTPGALLTSIVKPVSKLGVNITELFTAINDVSPLVYIGFDNAKPAMSILRNIPVPAPVSERHPVTA